MHPTFLDEGHREWMEAFILWRVENGDLDIEAMARKIAVFATPARPDNVGAVEEIDRLQLALGERLEDNPDPNAPTLPKYPSPEDCKAALTYIKAQ